MTERTFLAVDKKYLNTGLKSLDILIIAQIEEFERNNCKCYMTNKQFANTFGESESTIKRAIAKLDRFNIINKNTVIINGNGKATKQRILTLNLNWEWKGQNEPTKMEGSNLSVGRVKNKEWKGQNDPIKEKKKYKEKDNIRETILNLVSFDEEIQEDLSCGLIKPEECMPKPFQSFVIEELDRLGKDVRFIVSYDRIKSYKGDRYMGSYSEIS